MIALELLAARWAAFFAQEIGLHHVVLEGDSEFVNNSLKFGTNLGSMHGHLIKDILFYVNYFQSISFGFNILVIIRIYDHLKFLWEIYS